MRRSTTQFGPMRLRLTLAALAGAAIVGGIIAWQERDSGKAAARGATRAGALPVRIFTNPGATTPQLPLWGALAQECQGVFAPTTELWKTTAHLQSLLLAAEGDLWVGHIDGFARARARGAPIVLLAVTGWRKFSLVSSDPAVTGFTSFADRSLPYAPMGCPSVDILRAVMGGALGQVEWVPHEPKQLALRMMQGKIDSALLPEPLVTVLLRKVDGLRVVAHVEDEYARINQGRARMPIAGIAAHADFIRENPREIARLTAGIVAAAARLAATPKTAARVLPAEFSEFVSREDVEASLSRDLILAVEAAEAREEILHYLRIVAPDVFADGGSLGPGFFGASYADQDP